MPAGRGPAPTRWNLIRTTRRLERVERGAELLGRKRRALVGELFGLARPALEGRTRLAERARTAYPALLDALAVRGGAETRALGWPARGLEVELDLRETWGIRVARVSGADDVRRTPPRRGVGPAGTGPAPAIAADEFEDFVALLLEAATQETQIRRLARALARTTRQVNTLEQRVAPALERQAASIRRTLEEREREDHLRLRRLGRRRSRPGTASGPRPGPDDGPRSGPHDGPRPDRAKSPHAR